ncbi:hypothetical protein [Pseudoduganella sp. HUAS MS19]
MSCSDSQAFRFIDQFLGQHLPGAIVDPASLIRHAARFTSAGLMNVLLSISLAAAPRAALR